MPAVLPVFGQFMHHIRAFPTFYYSKATILALWVALGPIFMTSMHKSETITTLPISGELHEICLVLLKDGMGLKRTHLGSDLLGTGWGLVEHG